MLDMLFDPPERNPGEKSIKWILFDSAIIAGIAFIASLPENRMPDIFDLYVALKAFIYSFLLQLAVERGLKKYVNRGKQE